MPDYYHPYSETFLANPWPVYRRMRDESPAYFVEELNLWALSRFTDVWQASMDRAHFTASQGTSLDTLLFRTAPPPIFLFMDPPEHAEHRNLVSSSYQKSALAALETTIRERTRAHIESCLPRGELDVHALATKIGLQTTADLLGLRHADLEHIRALLDIFFHREPGIRGTTPAGLQAVADIHTFVMNLIQEYRRHPPPAGTHVHTWLNAAVNGRPMTDEQTFMSIFALSITGSDTLALTCAGTFYYLSEHPQQLAMVRADPTLVPHAFNETARYDQPTNILGRRVTQDFELHGHTIRAGQNVMFLFASANRDEREFENPDTYQISRRPRRTLTFGAGFHACLGQHLARLEGRIIIEELLAALGEFEVDKSRCRRLFGEFLQGYCCVPLLFAPR